MRIVIHRGTNEIGGSCVEIANQNCRLLFDAGQPLDDSPASLPKDIDLFDAVFVSHGHQDHYGLIDMLPPSIPLYMSDVALNFAKSLRIFTKQQPLPQLEHRSLKAGVLVTIKGLEVTPFLVDHSAPDAFSFLIRSENKTVFYTGDFRAHGRKPQTIDFICKNVPSKIDALLLEGTMVRRTNSAYESESDVELGIYETIKATKGAVCVSCSAQNIDRIVSVFRAAKRSSRELVIDIYTAWILRIAQSISTSIPDIGWENIRVLSRGRAASGYYQKLKENREFFGSFVNELYSKKTEISVATIQERPDKYVLKLSDFWTNEILQQTKIASTIIYSQWPGYLEKNRPHYNENAAKLRQLENSIFKIIHTSGHAVLHDLQTLEKALAPRRVIPIHTEYKSEYAQHFGNVQILEDGTGIFI